MEEFNGLMSSNVNVCTSSQIGNGEADQRKLEINERVKIALMKSEATLLEFRNRMAWKSPKMPNL